MTAKGNSVRRNGADEIDHIHDPTLESRDVQRWFQDAAMDRALDQRHDESRRRSVPYGHDPLISGTGRPLSRRRERSQNPVLNQAVDEAEENSGSYRWGGGSMSGSMKALDEVVNPVLGARQHREPRVWNVADDYDEYVEDERRR